MSEDVRITYNGGWKELNSMRFSLITLVLLNIVQTILLGIMVLERTVN